MKSIGAIARALALAVRVSVTLAIGFGGTVAFAQAVPPSITPLKTEPDHNQVNITDGMIRINVPSLSTPAAPRLTFDLVQNVMPHLVAQIGADASGYISSSISVHSGSSTSDAFSCHADDVCRNVKSEGAVIDGDVVNGSYYNFTQSQTGAVYVFDKLEYDSGYVQQVRKLQYYASSATYPDGEVITYTYETAPYYNRTLYRISRMSSNLGFYITFTYQGSDALNNPGAWTSVAQATLYNAGAPSAPLSQLTYGSNGSITDLAGRVFQCGGCINTVGALVEWSSAALTLPGETGVAEQANSNGDVLYPVIASVVRDGVTWSYAYTNLQKTSLGGGGNSYTGVTVSGPAGYHVTYNIQPIGLSSPNLITSIVDSLGRTTSYAYDNNFRPTLITSPEGNSVQIAYDSYGNITSKISNSKPGSGLAAITETAAIDPVACSTNRVLCFRPISYVDGLGRQTDLAYDGAGRLIQQTDPADGSGVRRVKYLTYSGSFTAPSQVRVCGLGTTCGTSAEIKTQYTYWGLTALPLTETRIDGVTGTSLTTSYIYDNAGRLLSEDGPLPGTNDAKYFRYDVLGRKTWEIGPANADGSRPATRYTYRNSDDKVVTVETGTIPDPNSTALSVTTRVDTTYDSRRYPVQTAASSGGTTLTVGSASFDDRGQQICKTARMNPAVYGALPSDACTLGTQGSAGPDRIVRNSYDAAGQLLQIQKAYGTSLQQNYATYTYSQNSKQTSVTDANGNLAALAYDGFDRLSQWTFPSKTTAGQTNPADYESYGYDAAGNRTSLRKRDGVTLTYQYDGLNRVIVKTVPASASGAAGYSVYSGYDVRGLQLYARFGSASGQGVTNTYDEFGQLTSSTTTMGGTSRTLSYQYDVAGNRLQVLHPDGVHFDLLYDSGNRMISGNWTSPGLSNVVFMGLNYDGLGRRSYTGLASGHTTLAYDGISRLTSSSYVFVNGTATDTLGYNPASQIVSEARSDDALVWTGGVALTRNYAVNGLNQYTSAGSATFAYDMNGNLTSDGSNAYVYDAENRLVSAGSSGGTTLAYDPLGRLWQTSSASYGITQFVYDGDHDAVEYDGAGNVRRRFFWGPGVDEPFIQDEGSALNCSGTYFLHADHQGSVVAAAACSGNRVSANTYDEYGIPGAANWGRFQYTGQAWIPDLGMYYYKARIYSPTLGRFLQTDPIGYKDDVNLYAYVGDDPIDGTDPSGDCTGSNVQGKDGQCSGGGFTTGAGSYAWGPAHDGPNTSLTSRASSAAKGSGTAAAAAGIGHNGGPPLDELAKARVGLLGILGKIIGTIPALLWSDPAGPRIEANLPADKSQLGHIFADRPGHYSTDTLGNRGEIFRALADPDQVSVNRFGFTVVSRVNDNGTQTWAIIRGTTIQNAGVNNIPRPIQEISR